MILIHKLSVAQEVLALLGTIDLYKVLSPMNKFENKFYNKDKTDYLRIINMSEQDFIKNIIKNSLSYQKKIFSSLFTCYLNLHLKDLSSYKTQSRVSPFSPYICISHTMCDTIIKHKILTLKKIEEKLLLFNNYTQLLTCLDKHQTQQLSNFIYLDIIDENYYSIDLLKKINNNKVWIKDRYMNFAEIIAASFIHIKINHNNRFLYHDYFRGSITNNHIFIIDCPYFRMEEIYSIVKEHDEIKNKFTHYYQQSFTNCYTKQDIVDMFQNLNNKQQIINDVFDFDFITIIPENHLEKKELILLEQQTFEKNNTHKRTLKI